MPMRAARVAATLVLALTVFAVAPDATPAAAADPSPSALTSPAASPAVSPDRSPAATLPPSVGAPGTTTAGTTIRGAIGVVIGLIIVVIGWRRRRRPATPPVVRRPGPR